MNTFDVTIMVVDDDAFSMGVAKKVLSKDGYELMTAPSGYIALELLRKKIPDLLLLDIDMPQMDGFELLERIKKDSRLADIPVIFLTAVSNEDVEIRCFEAGAMDFITKPFAGDILRRRVERTLELNMLQKKFRHEAEVNTKLAAEKESQLDRLSLQLVEALSGTVEAKDKYTNGHSSRVAKYSMEIVKRMGGDSQEQQHIYYIGLLHDVGKIGVPDEIINKPERLTEAEFAKMKEHAAIGSNILRHISEIPDISVGARWHHERFDGKGYPDGLKGKDIPYIARVIAVADAYDAMTSNRSYRSSLPQEYAKQEIIKGIGTQFDPDIAKVMVQIIEEDVEYKFREIIKTTYNILLVDDDTVNLRMAEFALSKVGKYKVFCAQTGRQCLEMLNKTDIDLVLLDVEMPELNGLETLEIIRQNPLYRDLPIVFLTADSSVNTIIRAMKFGLSGYITKPFVPSYLIQKVGDLLSMPHVKDK